MAPRIKTGRGLPPRKTPAPPATFANISHAPVGAASNRRTDKLRQLCNRPQQKLDKEYYDNFDRTFGERPRGNFKLIIDDAAAQRRREAAQAFKTNFDRIFGSKT